MLQPKEEGLIGKYQGMEAQPSQPSQPPAHLGEVRDRNLRPVSVRVL